MKKLFLLLNLILSTLLYAQKQKLDTVELKNLKINSSFFITEFSTLEKYIDPSETKGNVFLGKDLDYPFISAKQNNIIYLVRNKWLSFYYLESAPKLIYIQSVSPNKDVILRLKGLKLTRSLKVESLGKVYKKSYYEYKKSNNSDMKEKFFKIVIKKENRYGILKLCFINGKFNYLVVTK